MDEKYCYPNSDVLRNKYDIRDKKLLERFEGQKIITKLIGLDINTNKINATYDIKHLVSVHKYLFGDIYDWAGCFRTENLYKSERVLSGGSAEYAEYKDINTELELLLKEYGELKWSEVEQINNVVTEFLIRLWTIHPFREGNTRTCLTFLWHYLTTKGISFRVELLRKNPMYVRDSLVMANYGEKKYIQKIMNDALEDSGEDNLLVEPFIVSNEEYQIAKSDYETFRAKYDIKKSKD